MMVIMVMLIMLVVVMLWGARGQLSTLLLPPGHHFSSPRLLRDRQKDVEPAAAGAYFLQLLAAVRNVPLLLLFLLRFGLPCHEQAALVALQGDHAAGGHGGAAGQSAHQSAVFTEDDR